MFLRPFIDTLRDVESGVLLDELTDVQREMLDACEKTNKSGEITITLKFKPEAAGQVSVKAEIKSKPPKLARGTTLFFKTPDGNLDRRDPRQQTLDLKSVDTAAPVALREARNG
jgi:hypothetical protein